MHQFYVWIVSAMTSTCWFKTYFNIFFSWYSIGLQHSQMFHVTDDKQLITMPGPSINYVVNYDVKSSYYFKPKAIDENDR